MWRTLAVLVPVRAYAISLAEKFDVDPLDLPIHLTPGQLWHAIDVSSHKLVDRSRRI